MPGWYVGASQSAWALHGRRLPVAGDARTIATGSSTATIGGWVPALTPTSLVLATIQGNVAGVWVRGVSIDTAGNAFTIRLNKVAPSHVTVGYFIIR